MNLETQVQPLFVDLEANPDDSSALARIERTFGAGERWGELVTLLHARAEGAGSGTLGARLLLTSGRIAHAHLGDAELASQLLALALQRAGSEPVVHEVRLLTLAVRQQWDELIEYFGQAVHNASGAEEGARLYALMGTILHRIVGDEEQADEMYAQAQALDASRVATLWARQDLAAQQERWDRLAELLYAELEAAGEAGRQIELLLDLGDLYATRLGALEQARECYESVAAVEPENERARRGLAALQGGGASAPEASGGAPPPPEPGRRAEGANGVAAESSTGTIEVDEFSEASEPLSIVNEESEPVDLGAIDGEERARKVSEVEEFDEESAPAIEAERARDEPEPGAYDPGPLEEPKPFAEVLGATASVEPVEEEAAIVDEIPEGGESAAGDDPEDVVRAYLQSAREAEEPQEAHDALEAAAIVERLEVDDPALATAIWEAAIELGDELELFARQGWRYADRSWWTEFLGEYEGAAPAEFSARAWLLGAGDRERAAAAAEAGGVSEVLEVVADWEEAEQNWRKYQRALEQRYPDLEREERSKIVFARMAMLAEAMGDLDKQFDALRRLDRVSDDPSIKGRLGAVYAAQEKWPAYVDLLKQQADRLSEAQAEAKIALWRRAIGVYTGPMSNDMQAIALYKRILELDPSRAGALDRLDALYEKNNRTSERIALLEQKAELAGPTRRAIEMRRQIADLYVEKFRNQVEAIKAYEAILAIAPHDLGAIEYLKQAYAKRREWEKLIEVWERSIEAMEPGQERLNAYFEVAQLAADKIRDPERAIALWREALKRAPDSERAIGALEALYEKQRDWASVADLLALRARSEPDPSERASIYHKLGHLAAERVKDPERAIAAWESALAIDADDMKARKSLERLYLEAEQWSGLERLFGGAGAWADLARALEASARASAEPEARSELLVRAARIARDRLLDLERAEQALVSVHDEIDPSHEAAARELVPIYEHTGEAEGLERVLGVLLGHRDDPKERRELLVRLARNRRRAMNDLEGAIAWTAQIVAEDPSRASDADRLEELAAEAGRWDEVESLYESAIEQVDEGALRVALRVRLGRVLAEERSELDAALSVYEAILAEHSDHAGALGAMAKVYERQERWDELMTIYERRLSLVDDPADRVSALHGLARIAEQQAGDLDRAIATYLEARQAAPDDLDTLAELHRLYAERGQREELIEVMRAELEVIEAAGRARRQSAPSLIDVSTLVPSAAPSEAGPSEAPSILTEAEIARGARVALELASMADGEEALSALERAARALPRAEEVIDGLLAVMRDESRSREARSRAALALLGPLEIARRFEELAEALGAMAEGLKGSERVALLEERARVLTEELAEAERAQRAWAEVIEADPARDRRAELERCAQVSGAWDEVAALYEGVCERVGDELWFAYGFARARVLADELERPEEARAVYLEMLERRPDSERAIEELDALYRRGSHWEDLLDVYDRRIALAEGDAEARAALEVERAAIGFERLGRAAEAIEVLERLRERGEGGDKVMPALAAVYEAEGMYAALAEVRERQLAQASPAERAEASLALGRVLAGPLGRGAEAAALFERVASEEPERDEAFEALLELARSGEPEVALRAAEFLEPRYTERAMWRPLVDVLEVRAAHASGDEERAALYERMATLWEELDRPREAMAILARAFARRIAPEAAIAGMRRIAEVSGRWEELVEVLDAQAEEEQDLSVRRDLMRQQASVLLAELEDLDRSADALGRVLEMMPEDLETIEDLEKIYRHAERWDELVEVLQAKAAIVDDASAQRELLFQAGTIYEEIVDDAERAIEVYERLLTIDPSFGRAIDRLEVLYTLSSRWDELLAIYRRKLELADSEEATKDLLYVIGSLYQNELEAPDEAIDAYRQVLALDADDLGALEKLDALYEQTGRHAELLETLERQAEITQIPNDRVTLIWRIGRLYEGPMEDPQGAVAIYREALGADPSHAPTLEALARMIEVGRAPQEAGAVLVPIYEVSERWEDLIGVYRLLLGASDDRARRLELLREIAATYEGFLGDRAGAFAACAEAVAIAPDRAELLDQLERLGQALGEPEAVIERLDAIVEGGEADPEIAIALERRIARIEEVEIGDLEGAIRRHERVRDLEPGDAQALSALERLYAASADWDALAGVLAERIEGAESGEERGALMLRLASVERDGRDDAARAVAVLGDLLAERDGDEGAIELLEQMYRAGAEAEAVGAILEPHYAERGAYDKLIELYGARLARTEDRAERYDQLMQTARLYDERIGDARGAIEALGRAIIERPGEEEAARELERIAADEQMWPQAAQIYVELLEGEGLSDEARLSASLALGRIIAEELEMPLEARSPYEHALAIDPGDERALAALDTIYAMAEEWAALEGVLARRIEGTYDDVHLVDLNLRLAALRRDRLGDSEGAIKALRAVLAIDPVSPDALRGAEQLYQAVGDWEALYENLGAQAESTLDAKRQAALYRRQADLAEELLDRRGEALALLGRVLELDPGDRETLAKLRRLYLAEERYEEVVDVLAAEIEQSEDAEERLALYENLGVLYGDRLGDDVRAMEAWGAALEIDPQHLPALEALRDIHARRSDYYELASTLSRMLAHPDLDEGRRLALWIEQADIQSEMLMQPDEAIRAWRQVLTIEPGHAVALESLERLYLTEGHWAEAVDVLDVKLGSLQGAEERLEVAKKIAQIVRNELADPARAARYYEYALDLDPSDESIYAALAEIYRSQSSLESSQALANLFLTRAEVVDEDPIERAETMRQAAEVFERDLDQPESALVVLLSALTPETVAEEQSVAEIERLAAQTGLHSEVVERYDAILADLGDGEAKRRVHMMAGRLLADELAQPEAAIEHIEEARAMDPDEPETLDRLASLYERTASWEKLAEALSARVALSRDPDETVELWRRLGAVYEDQLVRIDPAVEAYLQILTIDEADPLALESLERIYEAYERWQDLIDILLQKVASSYDPDEAVRLRHRIARIYEERAGELDRAIAAYQDVLEVDEGHAPSLEALERLYTEQGRWEEVARILEQRVEHVLDAEERLQILARAAALAEEHFDDPERAIEAYLRMLEVEPQSLEAIEALERIYKAGDRPIDLIDALERHVGLLSDPRGRAALLREMARVQRDDLDDPHAAIESLVRSLEAEPSQLDALADLAALYERTLNWESAVQTYEALAGARSEAADRIRTLIDIGTILETQILDIPRAEDAYARALALRGDDEGALEPLANLLAGRQAWSELVALLKGAEEASRSLEQKAHYLARVGRVYADQMGDPVSALRYYERALEMDPSVTDAAEPLIEVYMREGRYERALPLLERVIASGRGDEEGAHRRALMLAETLDALGMSERALEAYHSAYEVDPHDLAGMMGLARALMAHDDLDAAFKIYQDVQLEHMERLTEEQAVEIFLHAGSIKERLGQNKRASDYYERVLDYDPAHREVIGRLMAVYESEGSWDRYIDLSRQLLSVEHDPARRFSELARIGDIYADQVRDPGMAMQTYMEALELDARSVTVLRKLLDLYRTTQQWPEAVGVLDRLIEIEESPAKRAKMIFVSGVIYRDEVQDPQGAIERFHAALDADASFLQAFQEIDRILTAQKEWKELERAYRGMLRRLKDAEENEAKPELMGMLWRNLGEIYRSRLGHMQSAIKAYEAALQFNPSDEEVRRILVQLYERTGQGKERLIEQHRALIEREPFRIESYRALLATYLQLKRYDEAWCMAQAMTFLQKAEPKEERFFRDRAPKGWKMARMTLDQESLGRLFHGSQDLGTTSIMRELTYAIGPLYARPHREVGIHKKKDKLDPDGALTFCRIYSNIVSRLSASAGAIPLELYQRLDQPVGLRNANVWKPALLVGADMFQGKNELELAFIIAKRVFWMMPFHYLGSLGFPTEQLRAFFMAALHLADPSFGFDQHLGEHGKAMFEAIGRYDASSAGYQLQLTKLAKTFLQSGKNPNLSQWLTGVDHTTSRFGLVMCGDLQTAAAGIKNDPMPLGKASVKEKLRELVRFAISEEYFAIRRQLGLQIRAS